MMDSFAFSMTAMIRSWPTSSLLRFSRIRRRLRRPMPDRDRDGRGACGEEARNGLLGSASSALALLPHAHVHDDRSALEAVHLTQTPLDEPPVLRVEESGREQHEGRRARGHL